MTAHTTPCRQDAEPAGKCKDCGAPLIQGTRRTTSHLKEFCNDRCRKRYWDHMNPEKRALIMKERNEKKRQKTGGRQPRKPINIYNPAHAEQSWANIKACTDPVTHRYKPQGSAPAGEDQEAKP